VSLRRTAVTGIASLLGSRVLRRLAEGRPAESLVAIDVAEPPSALGVRHRRLDFTEPASDQRLLELLREEDVETVVHAAFFTNRFSVPAINRWMFVRCL